MNKMTMRERMLAVMQGKEFDRIPFVQYDGLAAPNEEIWQSLGRDQLGILRWSQIYGVRHSDCYIESKKIKRDGKECIYSVLKTPIGNLTEEKVMETAYNSYMIKKHFIEKPEDYKILMEYFKDAQVYMDVERYLKDDREIGQDGIAMGTLDRTPYQQLFIHWISIEELSVHFVECPDIVEECISAMLELQMKVFEVVAAVCEKVYVPYINIPDNITAPLIGVDRFLKYCTPSYNLLRKMLPSEDTILGVHMDGDLRPLWKAIGESSVSALDSFSPKPDNDTSVGEAVSMWPDKRLFINFPSSVHTMEAKEIYTTACNILEEGGRTRRIWLQISENMPAGAWKISFPEIIRAIHEFAGR